MIFLASISELWENIAGGLTWVWEQLQNADWVSITTQLKNWILSGGALTFLVLGIKLGIPFLKNKKIAPILTAMTENVDSLRTDLMAENQTLKGGLFAVVDFVQTSAEINLSSKTLSAEQKARFEIIILGLQAVKTPLATQAAAKLEEIIADNVITKEEAVELAEINPEVEKVFGTKISDVKLGG